MWFDIMIDKLLKLFKYNRTVHSINSTWSQRARILCLINRHTCSNCWNVLHFVFWPLAGKNWVIWLAACLLCLTHEVCRRPKVYVCVYVSVCKAPAAVVGTSEVPNVPWTASIDSTVRILPVPNPPPPLFFSLSVSFRSPPLPSSPSVSRFVFT